MVGLIIHCSMVWLIIDCSMVGLILNESIDGLMDEYTITIINTDWSHILGIHNYQFSMLNYLYFGWI